MTINNFDILITNGNIVDGTGKDKYTADLGIQDDKIVAIGNLSEAQADTVIDATGKYVTPGFIDPHSHGDTSILFWPQAESYTMQGVTTIIGGNCGMSMAPLTQVWPFCAWEAGIASEVQPAYFNPFTFQLDLAQTKQAIKKTYGVDVDWATFGEFLDHVASVGSSINPYPMVGHGAVRSQVMGYDIHRAATDTEIAKMQDFVREALEAGAFGLGTGLDYPPGAYATTEEVIALAKTAGQYGGMYESHFRMSNAFSGAQGQFGVLDGIEEALRIGREAGVRIQLSHMFPGYNVTPDNSDVMARAYAEATIAVIEKGAASGVEVAYDVVPNTGAAFIYPHLIYLLRPWLLQAGSVAQLVKNLSIPDFTANVKENANRGAWLLLNPKFAQQHVADLGMMYQITQCENTSYVNQSVFEIGQEKGMDSFDAIFHIIKEDPYTKMSMNIFSSNELIKTFLDHHLAMPSCDGFCLDDKVELGSASPLNMMPHPNSYCYAIRYLTHYPKDRFEDNIRQMTGFPAQWFGIKDRGVLAEGKYADMVIFKKEALQTNEDYVEPRRYPDGLDYVLVNGKIVRDGKIHTGRRPGRVLRKQQ